MSEIVTKVLGRTEASRRRIGVALLVGVIAGALSAIVKFGWEVPFPPRTPERNATNPPQTMLELWFGMSPEQSHTLVYFNGNGGPIYSFIVHFAFAIIVALFYCVVAEYFPRIKMWQGAVFGFIAWIFFHVVLMPLTGLVPTPFPWVPGGQTWDEHFSECFGHILWVWSIEIVRRDLRNRITKEPDAEVPLNSR